MEKLPSKPAPLVEITYLKDVTSPEFKAGKKDEAKRIERHWAEQLVAEGYARFTTAENEHASIESGTDSPGE